MNQIERTHINGVEAGILWRPTGQPEMDLLEAAEFRAWPPRLPEQPIFYPVINHEYALQIATEWNTRDVANGNVGYVTRFMVRWSFLSAYNVKVVGGKRHAELWIPAEDLEAMNENLVGVIEVVDRVEGSR